MIRVAQVAVQTAHVGTARSKLREYEGADKRDCASQEPREKYKTGGVKPLRDDRRIHKDARRDNAAHHDERCIERAQSFSQARPLHSVTVTL